MLLQIAGNLSKIRAFGDLNEKQRLQKLMFPSRLHYNVQNGTYRTAETNQLILSMVSPVRVSEGHKTRNPSQTAKGSALVARDGFEPPQTEPKSVVLPLDDRANSVRLSPNGTAKIIISQTFANHCCKKYANAVVITCFKAVRRRASGLSAPFEGRPFVPESHLKKARLRPKGRTCLR